MKLTARAVGVVCAIIEICHDFEAEFAPAMISSITLFSQYVRPGSIREQARSPPPRTLEKILTFVRNQVGGGFWRKAFRPRADARLIVECNAGLQYALDVCI